MRLSLTSSSSWPALRISSLSPMAMVKGLWIIIMAVGLIQTLVPAMAMTDAALAAMPVIFTVTSFGYSRSMV